MELHSRRADIDDIPILQLPLSLNLYTVHLCYAPSPGTGYGLAMGFSPDDLALNQLRVDATKILNFM